MSRPQTDLASEYSSLLEADLITNNHKPTKQYFRKLKYTRTLRAAFCQNILKINPIEGLFSTKKPYKLLKQSSIISIFNPLRVLYRNATSEQLETKKGETIYASIRSYYETKKAEPAENLPMG